jgi:ribosomal peptide maturation radical SAM protein 1
MKGALLVSMPFGNTLRPSLGLSLLQAALLREGLPCQVRYLNLRFAERIGGPQYERIADSSPNLLQGDWIFASDLFGDRVPPPERYFAQVLRCGRVAPFESERSRNDHAKPDVDLLGVREQVGPFLDECLAAVPWDDYALVGFTTTFQQNTAALALARLLKERYPALAIVFGGANCEGEMGIALHRLFPFVDYVCSGEGDLAFPRLARGILRGEAVGEIAGIIRRVDGQTVVPKRASAPVLDMDALPIPDYDDFLVQRAAVKLQLSAGPYLPIETARGCWWGQKSHCTFCGLNGSTMQFRAKSPERALAEFTHLAQRYHPRGIDAVDNIIDMSYFRAVLPRLAELQMQVDLFYETKANLRKEQVRLLREAGVVRIQPGIESLSSNVLRLMRKGVSALQNVQLLRWCAEYMVEPCWNIIAGIPGEDPADYARQAEIVPLLTHLTPPSGVGPVRLDRFSPLLTNAAAHGLSNVRATRAYHYVYPFPPEDLMALAYYFDFDYADGREPLRYADELRRQVEAWISDQPRSELVSLVAGDTLVIWDTRSVAVREQYRFRALRRIVYEYCDQARTRAQIEAYLGTLPERDTGNADFDTVLGELLEAGLVLHEDGHYLSLAVAGGYQLKFLTQRFADRLPPPIGAKPILVRLAAQLAGKSA